MTKTIGKPLPSAKPSKHDVLAQVWHFVYYVEERMACPQLFDKSVMKTKCEQVKKILTEAEGEHAQITSIVDGRSKHKG